MSFTNLPATTFFPTLGGPDEAEIKAAHAIIQLSRDAIKAQKAGTMFKCASCMSISPISEMTYIQTYWYTTPHGCTGGDYWSEGEGMIPCPECGIEHRTHFSPGLESLKEYFGTQIRRDK